MKKKPRKGSFAYEIDRLAPVIPRITDLASALVEADDYPIDQAISLLRAAHKRAKKDFLANQKANVVSSLTKGT